MRIAQVAPIYESVPPRRYGGTERIVSYLTEELVRLGHDVTLFASADSTTSARLVPVVPQPLRTDSGYEDAIAYQILQMQKVSDLAGEFDLIHYHTDYFHFPLSRMMSCTHVTTLHGRLDLPACEKIYDEFGEMPVVSISRNQRLPLAGKANWAGNVYHGLPTSLYTLQDRPRSYLAFLGRISREKRLDLAIEIARAAKLPLKVAAKIDPYDREYFEREIRHLLDDPCVEFIGEIGESGKGDFLQGAAALLFPVDWPEPFGLVLIEAMACGTPVVAFRRGSVPEVVTDGRTGFIVDSVGEAVAAVARVGELDPEAIRREFEVRFDARRMALEYVDIYRNLLRQKRPIPRQAQRPSRTSTRRAGDGWTREA